MILPKLPRGIERDDTEHGKIYYTRAQMMAYGQECADIAMGIVARKDDPSDARNYSKAVDDLFQKFGMTK